jgi:hypothetical protein
VIAVAPCGPPVSAFLERNADAGETKHPRSVACSRSHAADNAKPLYGFTAAYTCHVLWVDGESESCVFEKGSQIACGFLPEGCESLVRRSASPKRLEYAGHPRHKRSLRGPAPSGEATLNRPP